METAKASSWVPWAVGERGGGQKGLRHYALKTLSKRFYRFNNWFR
jgi:hypothetical protein